MKTTTQLRVTTTKDNKRKVKELIGKSSYHDMMEFFLSMIDLKTAKGAQRVEIQLLKWFNFGTDAKITKNRIFNLMGGTVNYQTVGKVMEMYKSEIESFNNKF